MRGGSASVAVPPPRRRAGATLLLVLGIVALALSTLVLAATTFHARLRLTRDTLRREEARDGLLACVSNAVALLLADTNGVDHLGESWAAPLAEPPLRAGLEDESARIPLAVAGTNLLAELLSPELAGDASGPFRPGDAGEGTSPLAASLAAWRDQWRSEHRGEDPPSLGFYLDALGPAGPAQAASLAALATPHGSGPVNLNTASPAVVALLLRACGAAPPLADEMAGRLAAARASGAVAVSPGRRTLAAFLIGPGRPPTDAEAAVLASAEPLFGTSSDLFRGRFECPAPAVSFTFVYDRSARRFLLWDESPAPWRP